MAALFTLDPASKLFSSKDVIIMPRLNKNTLIPLILTFEDNTFYLEPNETGFTLYSDLLSWPFFQLHEPILLINGIAANPEQVHLVYIKQNGDLCYSIVTTTGQSQTNILCSLDIHHNRYRNLMVLTQGTMIHIFYAYAHQAINDLWRLEHLYWNGKNWQTFHLGEIVHPRQPLYSVSIDNKRNLHLLMLTHQGQFSILMTNRFNSAFNLWGNRIHALSIPHDIVDMTALITSDNTHHLFWAAKSARNQFTLGWAHKNGVHELSKAWQLSASPLKACDPPWHGIGALEVNGTIWLLCNAAHQNLITLKNGKWELILSQQLNLRPLQLIRNHNNFQVISNWAKLNTLRIPAFANELGLSKPETIITTASTPMPSINQYSAYTDPRPLQAPHPYSSPVLETHSPQAPEPRSSQVPEPHSSLVPEPHSSQAPEPHSSLVPEPHSSQSQALDQESDNEPSKLQLTDPNIIPLSIPETIGSLTNAIHDLTKEKNDIAFALETHLSKFAQTESSIERIEKQIALLQMDIEVLNEKGFWRRWFK